MRANRRRVLTILAAAAGAAMPPRPPAGAETYSWCGTALGAEARIVMAGLSRGEAEHAVRLARQEAERLEASFSLYRPDSELSRLNRDGVLDRPSQDFRILLARSLRAWEATEGAFNPAIQPLWSFLAHHFVSKPGGTEPRPGQLKGLLARCDPSRITLSSTRIEVDRGMALTFNGIAQGYVTDAAAGLLEAQGLGNILIDLGELYALPGKSWEIAIDGSDQRLPLARKAVAQSAGRGTVFTADEKWHHLIDPFTGQSANRFASVTIAAATATEADLLSTALFVARPGRHAAILARHPGARAFVEEKPAPA
jgi:thiamine biosynthesis lipoprotein